MTSENRTILTSTTSPAVVTRHEAGAHLPARGKEGEPEGARSKPGQRPDVDDGSEEDQEKGLRT